MRNISEVILIYRNKDNSETFEQPLTDITTSGTLIDPETGDDLELVGWRYRRSPKTTKPNNADDGLFAKTADALDSLWDNLLP